LLSLEALTKLAGSECVWARVNGDVVGEYGRRLAHLIATLTLPRHAGDTGGTESAWRAAYLRHWAGVERVWLGGGLAAALGVPLLEAVHAEMVRLGSPGQLVVLLAPFADVLPLIGAAGSRSNAHSSTVVLDFGHTSIKRAVATIADYRLVRLDLLPSVVVAQMSEHIMPFMLDVVADTLNTARQRFGPTDDVVVVSIASYVIGSRPVAAGASRYLPLSETDSAALDAELVRRTNQAVHISFVHDGTAAARGLINPGGRAAVIMLGTTLGVGFAGPAVGVLPVSSELVVARAESGSVGGADGN
jgi:hypothetical protein